MRKVIKKRGWILVTDDADEGPAVPLECSTCHLVMSTYADVLAWNQWGCCDWCQQLWVGDGERWRTGWRPAEITVEAIKESRRFR